MLIYSMAKKYICFDNGLYDEIVVVVDSNNHLDVANKFGLKDDKILSAGFVGALETGAPYCYGGSFSLKKDHRDIDTEILIRCLNQ